MFGGLVANWLREGVCGDAYDFGFGDYFGGGGDWFLIDIKPYSLIYGL